MISPENILNWILFTPLAGAALVLLIPGERRNLIRLLSNVTMLAGFLVSLPLVGWFDKTNPGFQFTLSAEWIPSLGVRYELGIDGISFWLVLLTTLLGFLAVLSSWAFIQERVKEYYIMFLLLQTGMLGVFMALDLFLFYVFWEVMLVPMYFIIGIWGHERRLYAAIKFFLYTLFGSVLMLLGILGLYFFHAGVHQSGGVCPSVGVAGHTVAEVYTFSVPVYLDFARALPFEWQFWIFWAFFISFAIKVPMFPFHTWLPDAHTEAPTAGSVILAGVLLKMGSYGLMRFSLPMFPDAAIHAVPYVVGLSLIAIIYGALVCLMQKDMKKLIAYSSVSHMGFVTLGIFALNQAGLEGSLLQQINHGLSTGALFLIVGLLYERRHTREISEFGGLSTPMPMFAAIYLIISLASLGMPLLNGFVGEFVILVGTWQVNRMWAVMAAVGIILAAAYLLWLYQRVMFGEVTNPKNKTLKDINLREAMTLVPLVVLCFWIGVYPQPYFEAMRASIQQVVARVHGAAKPPAPVAAPVQTPAPPAAPAASEEAPATR
ncbi:MAG TPA: NADH-quinone oxidoreductase subunit M [Candidatus Xenobia bacterium]|nr:NADH-quinone oxidoreductase subunit M [Candidatus Xenobia bacterium]